MFCSCSAQIPLPLLALQIMESLLRNRLIRNFLTRFTDDKAKEQAAKLTIILGIQTLQSQGRDASVDLNELETMIMQHAATYVLLNCCDLIASRCLCLVELPQKLFLASRLN